MLTSQEDRAPLRPRLLCVYADPRVQTTIAVALAELPLTCVSHGFDAIRARNEAPADAYLISYWLPDWNGCALCRDIRKADPHVPICMFGRDNDLHRKRTMRAGADVFILEEDIPDKLPLALRRLLDSVSLRRVGAEECRRRAMAEELRRRLADDAEQATLAAGALGSIERTTRAKALVAYLDGGGTLAGFERSWRRVFESALAEMSAHQKPAPQRIIVRGERANGAGSADDERCERPDAKEIGRC